MLTEKIANYVENKSKECYTFQIVPYCIKNQNAYFEFDNIFHKNNHKMRQSKLLADVQLSVITKKITKPLEKKVYEFF